MEYLLRLLIDKIESSEKQWRPGAVGGKSLSNKDGSLYDTKKHLKSDVVEEAKELEKTGVVKIDWVPGYRDKDIQALKYRQEDIPKIYKLYRENVDSQFQMKAEVLGEYQKELREELAVLKTNWIKDYYQDLLNACERKNIQKATLEKYQNQFRDRKLCWRGIDQLEEPIYKRMFSKKYLRGTKVFEKKYQKHVVAIAREYAEELVDDAMNDSEVLSCLLIEDYAQELAIKGPLHMSWPDGTLVKNEEWHYGNVLNSDTLRYAQIEDKQPEIKKVITIENKANYMMMLFEEHTLYIFTHGFFSPKESRFLQKVNRVLENTETEFYHSGDLDYGGIKIFQYIQKNIFPKLQPYQMDVETYEKYKDYAEDLEKTTIEKLKKLEVKEPGLQKLIQKIIDEGKGIEQESFLL